MFHGYGIRPIFCSIFIGVSQEKCHKQHNAPTQVKEFTSSGSACGANSLLIYHIITLIIIISQFYFCVFQATNDCHKLYGLIQHLWLLCLYFHFIVNISAKPQYLHPPIPLLQLNMLSLLFNSYVFYLILACRKSRQFHSELRTVSDNIQ